MQTRQAAAAGPCRAVRGWVSRSPPREHEQLRPRLHSRRRRERHNRSRGGAAGAALVRRGLVKTPRSAAFRYGAAVELVRKFPEGHAIPQPKVPWYEAVAPYVILVPALLFWWLGAVLIVSYLSCPKDRGGACLSSEMLSGSNTGSYTEIVLTAAISYLVAACCAVAVQVIILKRHVLLVWALALVCVAVSWYAFGVLFGLYPTPAGDRILL